MGVPAKSARVLVVDDEPITAAAITEYLIVHGFNAHAVHSVRAALAEIERHVPDIILLDLVMPVEGGMELLAELRQDPEMQTLPVIVASGVKDTEAIVGALRAGASDYVSKPVDLPVLLARVERHLALAEAMANLERLSALSRQMTSESRLGRQSASRKQAQELVELEVHRARRHRNSMALLAIQLDQFDEIFNRHGQDAAESLLRQFVENLSGILRRCDRVCHIGSHAFLIILPQVDKSEATATAQQICWRMASPPRELPSSMRSNVSVGVVNLALRSECGAQELFTHGLEAMQEAVSQGGNRVFTFAQSEQPATR